MIFATLAPWFPPYVRVLGFDKSKINEVLDIEERFRPEVLITVGYAAEKVEPSYRLPVDEIIDKR